MAGFNTNDRNFSVTKMSEKNDRNVSVKKTAPQWWKI